MSAELLQFLFGFDTKAVARFVPREKFIERRTTDGVSIAQLGHNFIKHFLTKIESDVWPAKLKVFTLQNPARDLPKKDDGSGIVLPGIISELHSRHETLLAQSFQLLAHKERTRNLWQLKGYSRDERGALMTVHALWLTSAAGWFIEAHSVEAPRRWRGSFQIVSR